MEASVHCEKRKTKQHGISWFSWFNFYNEGRNPIPVNANITMMGQQVAIMSLFLKAIKSILSVASDCVFAATSQKKTIGNHCVHWTHIEV